MCRNRWDSASYVLGLNLLLTGCNSSPSQDILGSFFPAWMLCALLSIIASVIIHIVLKRTGIEAFVPMRAAVYLALTILLTFVLWLVWFGN